MEPPPALRRPFLQWCWLPPALWAGMLWYVPRSVAASQPAFLYALFVPAVLSVAGLVLGVYLVTLAARRTHQIDLLVVLATFLSSSPVLSYLLRNVLR
jgi:hypothetical protein